MLRGGREGKGKGREGWRRGPANASEPPIHFWLIRLANLVVGGGGGGGVGGVGGGGGVCVCGGGGREGGAKGRALKRRASFFTGL